MLSSERVNKPIPAGLPPTELKSPPTPVCAPIALNLAVLPHWDLEKRNASSEYWAYRLPVAVTMTTKENKTLNFITYRS
jgi:hypothetical protein